MISKLLQKADMLVSPYEFNVHRREKSLTTLGGILTIIIFSFTGLYVASIFYKALTSQDSIYAGSASDTNQQFQLDDTNVLFSLEISSTNGTIYSDLTQLSQYFGIKVEYIQQQRITDIIGFNRNYSTLNISKCSSEMITQFNFPAASLTTLQKQNLLCFNGQFLVKGQFYDPYFAYLKLGIVVCTNTTEQVCKSADTIKQFISQGYLQQIVSVNIDLFVSDSKIKSTLNETNPADKFPTNIYWKLTTGIGNNEDIYIAPVQMDLKYNQLFNYFDDQLSVNTIYTASTVVRQERRQEPIEIKPGASLCALYLRASQTSQYYFAQQSDWPPILLSSISEATGLALAVMEFMKIFYKLYNDHKTFEVLMNSVFKFDMASQKKKRNSLTPIKIQVNQVSNSEQSQLDKIFNFQITYTFYQFIKYQCSKIIKLCCKSASRQKSELVISQMAKTKIENDLDLTNILKKLYEIDCLKLFFFDDDQLVLFNSFCSPVFQDTLVKQKNLLALIQGNSIKRQQNNLGNSQVSKLKVENQQVDFTFVATSEIPLSVRLAKVARFFKAQLGAQTPDQLISTFTKILQDENENTQLNSKLLRFAKQNETLYKLVSQQVREHEHQQEVKSHFDIPLDSCVPDELCAKQSSKQKHPSLENPIIIQDQNAVSYMINSNSRQQGGSQSKNNSGNDM